MILKAKTSRHTGTISDRRRHRNSGCRRRLRRSLSEGRASVPQWSGTYRSAGVGDHVQTGIGVPQELGRSCRLHGRSPGWGYRVNNPRPDAVARSGGGSEMCVVPWYRQAKETKRGGRGGRKSQCLDSTEEAGELDPRGPGGWEARHRVTRPSAGNTWRTLSLHTVSPQCRRIVQYGFVTALARLWRSEGLLEEPDALMWARPDLWEPWAGNRPGRPGKPDYCGIARGAEG